MYINRLTGEKAETLSVVRNQRSREYRYVTQIPSESPTQTQFGEQTNVNAIIARFERTGELPKGNGPGQYADVTGLQGDLTDLHNKALDDQAKAAAFAAGWTPPSEEQSPAPVDDPTPPEPTETDGS